jgi:hypothetical protein
VTLEAEVGAVEVESMLPGEDALSMMDWVAVQLSGDGKGSWCAVRTKEGSC